jgi:hypothetical protein
MHVLHRPHLPRLVSVTLIAAILSIVISLALASTLSNLSQSGGGAGASTRHGAPAPSGSTLSTARRGMSNPFADPLNRPVPSLPWPTAPRS